MTWEIVLGLISVVSAALAVGKVIYGLSRTLTKLNCSVENLNTTLTNLTSENKTEHEELYGDIRYLQDSIDTHEIRITKIEEKGVNNK